LSSSILNTRNSFSGWCEESEILDYADQFPTVRKKFFRVWHPPSPQCEAEIELKDISLLTQHWPWFTNAKLVGTNYSPGFAEVWMGRPHKV